MDHKVRPKGLLKPTQRRVTKSEWKRLGVRRGLGDRRGPLLFDERPDVAVKVLPRGPEMRLYPNLTRIVRVGDEEGDKRVIHG